MTSLVTFENVPRPAGVLSILVAAYAALLPYQFQVGVKFNFAPADCLLLLILMLAVGQLRFCGKAWSVWHLAIALTFVAGSFVAALRFGTLDRYELLNKDAGLVMSFLAYAAITSSVFEWEDIRRIAHVFTWSVVIQNGVAVAAFLAAYSFHTVNPFARYDGSRLSGLLLDPNAYGGLLVAALVIAESASWGPAPLFRQGSLWASRVSLGLGILFTFSRSAWIALGLGLLLLCVLRWRIAGRVMATGLIVAPLLLAMMGPRFIPILEVMASRPRQVEGRFELIHDALIAFGRHPLFGGGIGSFRLSEGEVAHNSAMWFLADFGIFGLVIFFGFMGWFFTTGWFAYRFAPVREQPVALGLLVAQTAMLGLAMGIEAFNQRHWWLVLGLIAAAYSLALRRMGHLPTQC